jgi:hypothetical protein
MTLKWKYPIGPITALALFTSFLANLHYRPTKSFESRKYKVTYIDDWNMLIVLVLFYLDSEKANEMSRSC